jgi:hypothetical protein
MGRGGWERSACMYVRLFLSHEKAGEKGFVLLWLIDKHATQFS